jgi:hypothetical protein
MLSCYSFNVNLVRLAASSALQLYVAFIILDAAVDEIALGEVLVHQHVVSQRGDAAREEHPVFVVAGHLTLHHPRTARVRFRHHLKEGAQSVPDYRGGKRGQMLRAPPPGGGPRGP